MLQVAIALAIISTRHRRLPAERTPQTDIAPKDSGAPGGEPCASGLKEIGST
jgi:hypothetical protein